MRARAEYVEGGEKNSKYFANLEKKRASAKTINRLNKNGKDITNNKLILKELEQYYKTLYNFQELDADNITKFNKYINVKLSDEEKNNIEGPASEYECTIALKSMKNNKSPGSDGITTEFYKIFWNLKTGT